jgi:ABC-type transport system involved in multi-copper enzyme maturation permease subunit
MYLIENPVLQRELLVNLRMRRAFVLLFAYVALLGAVVYGAWPQDTRIDLTANSDRPEAAKKLVDLFFLGQYLLATLMAPSFAAGAITGEKERGTYEMLLASPMRPGAIVLGKLFASMCHLALLVFASLPIVMLCLPLGGVSFYEVLAQYLALVLSIVTFGMISLAASSYFRRTAAALVVSYLVILPLALPGVLFWYLSSGSGETRLTVTVMVLLIACPAICGTLYFATTARLLHPPDVGSEAKDVVDLGEELELAVGMVIQSDQFPDRLFAPTKRTDFMEDGANPVYDKEMRSELFSQGTLMLRVVIQASMLLALPLMAVCLYMRPEYAPWYLAYIVLFNVLVGPVFSAGSVASERERQTLELLLTTTLSPWQILWGKLLSGLRISCVLTMFLLWGLVLAWLLPPWPYLGDTVSLLCYGLIVLVTSLTTTTVALFSSVIFRRSSVSMTTSYLIIGVLFAAPLAVSFLGHAFSGNGVAVAPGATATASAGAGDGVTEVAAVEADPSGAESGKAVVPSAAPAGTSPNVRVPAWRRWIGVSSPILVAFRLPLLDGQSGGNVTERPRRTWPGSSPVDWPVFGGFLVFYGVLNLALLAAMMWLFHVRWRVAT